ncbi:hypothetical protein BH20GEM1_BH20GEM1_10240 [soil metagenome]
MPLLVLDEQLERPQLITALTDRGVDVTTVGDLGATGRPDPDVVRRVEAQHSGPWVLVTMDLTIIEDFPGFEWGRYAIAWVQVRKEVRGAAAERAKAEIIHRHAHTIRQQGRGDHHTYTRERHYKHPPSLTSQLERRA